MSFHLAQVNIAFARYERDDPRFAGFIDNLARVYALAESTPGFIWRHVTVNDDAEAKSVYADDTLIFNMSLWESREALAAFVYEGEHLEILRQRGDWFVPQDRPTMALWWQAAGSIPTITETRHRLELLARAGPCEDAFTFRSFFAPPDQRETGNG